MFETCLKWLWIRLCITWKDNLSSEKESGSLKNHYENVYHEDWFLVKVLARSENSKNPLDKKSMIFSITTDLSQKMPAVNLF